MKWFLGRGKANHREVPGHPQRAAGTGVDSAGREQAEWKFRALFENGPLGVAYHRMVYDDAGKPVDFLFIDVNANYVELTGVDPRGKTVREAFPGIENDPFDWIGTYARVARTGESIRFEQYLQANDRWYDCVGYQYQPDHFVVAFLEVTARKRAEEQLRQKSAELDRYFNLSLDLLCIADRDGQFLRLNPEWEKVLGYSVPELEGRSFLDLVHPDDREGTIAAMSRLSAQEPVLNFENRYRCKDDSYRWIEWRSQQQDGLLYATARDITNRKRAAQALAESEEKYRTLFDGAGEAIFIHDVDRLLAVNQRACERLGYTRAELMSLPPGALDTPEQSLSLPERVAMVLAQGHLAFETEHQRKDGSRVPIEGTSQLVTWGGQPAIMSICRDITERKRTQAALDAESATLAAIIDNNPLSMQILDKDGRTLKTNLAHTAIFGAAPPPDYSMFTDPLVEAQGLSGLWERMQSSEVVVFPEVAYNAHEVIPELPDVPVWVRTVGFSIPGAAGRPERYILMHEDVTQQRAAEQALRESESRFRSYADNSPIGIFICDENRCFLQVNPAAVTITGYSREELLTLAIPDILPPESHEFAARAFGEVVDTGQVKGEFGFRHRDGRIRTWSLDAVRLSPARFMGMITDITERRRAEQELRESEGNYRALLESLSTGVVVHGPDTSILVTNAMATSLLGLSAEQMLGRTAVDPRWRFLHEDGSPMQIEDYPVNRVLASGESFRNLVGCIICPDRPEPTWVLCSGYPVKDAEGRIEQVVVTFADITERKRVEAEKAQLQAQLLQSQKMESLGILAGGVAHDMNNVLGAILGVATAGIESLPGDSPARSAFQTIIQAATRGGNTVKSLLGFARQSPAEERVLDINEVFREEIRLLERTTLAKVHLELDLADDLRPIRGDAGALASAFLNLCVNAVAAMPENGTLTLHTRNVDHDWIEVMVEDTGVGMSPEVLDKALDPFFTTKEVGRGTGLGLSMVYRTVMAHRGQMEILSELGRGTRVMMRFPACDTAAKAPGAAGEDRTVAAGSTALNVLAVDDDELIRCTMQALLEHMGHTVIIASSGEDAIAKLEGGLRPDVVILDLNMPGLGGAGTLPRLRALNPTVPVMLATGRVDQFALDLARTQPHVTLLPKPFSIGELRERLDPIAAGEGGGAV